MGFVILGAALIVVFFCFFSWRRRRWRRWAGDIDCATSLTTATTKLSSNTRRGDAFLGRETCTVPNEEAKVLVERARILGLTVRHFFGDERLIEKK